MSQLILNTNYFKFLESDDTCYYCKREMGESIYFVLINNFNTCVKRSLKGMINRFVSDCIYKLSGVLILILRILILR